ncbi:hypothetical protein BSL78_06813 [Apostichopus japonicus]|uniref:F5/8 type C domain-containing protein n=1 Tax=Stichopus japonicus TaxID=307972 RepID=A0A2G8L7X3_STIJA|nr:hypothetical protein BSL78_06813 [Apostichopus japonicus]
MDPSGIMPVEPVIINTTVPVELSITKPMGSTQRLTNTRRSVQVRHRDSGSHLYRYSAVIMKQNMLKSHVLVTILAAENNDRQLIQAVICYESVNSHWAVFKLIFVNRFVEPTLHIRSESITTCEDALGMESGQILDCQITASSFQETPTNPYPPTKARFNSDSGWAPGVRNGKPFSGNDYIQIAFGATYRISGIMMQKAWNNTIYCDTFRVSYSEEGIVWTDYQEAGSTVIFTNSWTQAEGNDTHDDYSFTSFSNLFNARYLRIPSPDLLERY